MATERVLNEYCSTIAAPGVSSAKWGDNVVGARLTQVAFKDGSLGGSYLPQASRRDLCRFTSPFPRLQTSPLICSTDGVCGIPVDSHPGRRAQCLFEYPRKSERRPGHCSLRGLPRRAGSEAAGWRAVATGSEVYLMKSSSSVARDQVGRKKRI
jgi:hypothetical protein